MRIFYSFLLAALIPVSLFSCASMPAQNEPVREGVVEAMESKDNPGMMVIPGGNFFMGVNSADPRDRPEHEVYVDTFEIAKYTVSAKDFAEFLNAKGNADDEYFSEDKYSTIAADAKAPGKYAARPGLENYPANNVSWFGAKAYCEWKGKRLPTEAEWEKAARGRDKRMYPWGNSPPDNAKAAYDQKWEDKGFQVMSPVDSHPEGASYYGVLNMAGNVWEWVADWYKQSYCEECNVDTDLDCVNCYVDLQYQSCTACAKNSQSLEKVGIPHIPLMNNPRGPSLGSFRILRGGSWFDSYGELSIRSTYRNWFDPSDRYFNFGFRCAK